MTTSPSPTRYPIESFGPELLQLLIKGGSEVVWIGPLPWYRCFALQARLNTLRSKMRKSQHPAYPVAARAKVSILWGKRAGLGDEPELKTSRIAKPLDREWPCKIRVQPQDFDFRADIEAAGVKIGGEPAKPPQAPKAPPSSLQQLPFVSPSPIEAAEAGDLDSLESWLGKGRRGGK